MASASEIIARLVLQGQREFVSGMDQAAQATGKTGKAAEQSGKKAGSAASGLLKWAAAGGAVYKAYGFFKGAVTQTTDLARATASLQRTTGMDARTASAWVVTAKERNVSTQALNRGFLSLGRQITAASKSTSSAAKTFRALGLSQKDLNNDTTEQRIRLVSDALRKVQDPLQRAALGQKLLGRNYLQLSSIMGKGSKAIADNESALRKSGATLDQSGVKKGLTMIKTQRELNAAMIGIKITIAQALMPILVTLAQNVQKLIERFRPWLELMARHPGVILAIAGALGTLVGVVKGYNMALKLWEIGTQAVTKAQWLLNIALDANPVGAIVIAVVALVAAIVLAYERVGWFRKGVQRAMHLAASAIRVVWGVLQPVIKGIERVAGWAGGAIGAVAGVIPGLAEGGSIVRGGQVLVGERGPELLSLPAGASVTPMDSPALVSRAPGGAQTLITKVYLDKRQIAQAVADVNSDHRARR